MLQRGMSAIQVKNVPPDLHAAVRRRAESEGKTVSDYILDLLRRDLALPSRREWVARLEQRRPVERVDSAAVLEGVRNTRDDELLGG
jgi:plasmid stability protein